LQEENELLQRQLEQQQRVQQERRQEVVRLRKGEVEGKQREAVLEANNARLERELKEIRGDMERIMTEQAEVLIQSEAWREENELLCAQVAEMRARAESAEGKVLEILEEQRGIIKEERRKERDVWLQKMIGFEGQLDTALQKFAAAKQGMCGREGRREGGKVGKVGKVEVCGWGNH